MQSSVVAILSVTCCIDQRRPFVQVAHTIRIDPVNTIISVRDGIVDLRCYLIILHPSIAYHVPVVQFCDLSKIDVIKEIKTLVVDCRNDQISVSYICPYVIGRNPCISVFKFEGVLHPLAAITVDFKC